MDTCTKDVFALDSSSQTQCSYAMHRLIWVIVCDLKYPVPAPIECTVKVLLHLFVRRNPKCMG